MLVVMGDISPVGQNVEISIYSSLGCNKDSYKIYFNSFEFIVKISTFKLVSNGKQDGILVKVNEYKWSLNISLITSKFLCNLLLLIINLERLSYLCI
jgi:hypothetical protein